MILRTKLRSNKFLTMLASIALLSSFSLVMHGAEPDPIVQVTGGQLKGRAIPGGGVTFKGVPFAQPPVGDLRWQDPAPVKPWSGVRDAGEFGQPCVQEDNGGAHQPPQEAGQEDCLTLNLWTGEWPSKSPKPVMVWLYGGGNTAGRTSVDLLNGTSLSRRGVILVTINYRVGLLAFFAHPGLSAESPHHTSGNYGMEDQLAALKWVHENIAKFGGDPKRVIVFGQSAGGEDSGYLAASPLSKGLISGAIQESGTQIHPIGSLAQVEQMGVQFAQSVGAPSDPAAAIKFLRAMPAHEINKLAVKAYGLDNFLMFPLVDGYLIPENPALVYKEGKELPIPIITGSNAREETRDYSIDDMKKVLKANFGSLAPKAEEFYGLANGGTGEEKDPLYGNALAQIPADTKHRCGAVAESMWRSSHGHTTYQYQFDVPGPGRPFTFHTAEIAFVFGTLSGPYTDADQKISHDIQTYWVNFAKTGNPNGDGLPEWPKADATRPYLEFTIHDGPVAKQSLRPEICNLYIEGLKETIPANTAGSRAVPAN